MLKMESRIGFPWIRKSTKGVDAKQICMLFSLRTGRRQNKNFTFKYVALYPLDSFLLPVAVFYKIAIFCKLNLFKRKTNYEKI